MEQYNKFERPFEYFLVQVLFADKISKFSKKDFNYCLFNYTCVYRRLNNDQPPNNGKPNFAWIILMFRLKFLNLQDKANLIFKVYKQNSKLFINSDGIDPQNKKFGFFEYEFKPKDNSIYLHFGNPDRTKRPLAKENIGQRKIELQMLIEDVTKNYPNIKIIESKSWLFSYEKFIQLFPNEFISSLKPRDFVFLGDSFWGQFISYNGFVKKDVMDKFSDNLEKSKTLEEAYLSFPFRPLEGKCSIIDFINNQ